MIISTIPIRKICIELDAPEVGKRAKILRVFPSLFIFPYSGL
jgi:hypothetical protein